MGIWIDTDMGFDDIAAVLVVLHANEVIDGVSLVFGNTPMEQVRRNAASAAMAFDWTFPIHEGRALPVLGKLETAERILGETGMPTAGLSLPAGQSLPVSDAFAALCRWLEEADASRRILALGPLTNLAALCLARPDLAAKITDLTWMGGGVTSGNHTASAEFNAFADPEALAIVLAHYLPLRMVDLDLCRKVFAYPDDIAPIRTAGGVNAALIADLLSGYVAIGTSRGRPGMAIYDPCAAVAFVNPGAISFRKARIDVELSGTLTRGRTVVETRESHAAFNAGYATDVHAETARAQILGALMKEAAK